MFAIGLDSNQFIRTTADNTKEMNLEIRSELEMDVYYPTYHSASGGANPGNTYAIDLILTNSDLLALDTNEDGKWDALQRVGMSETQLGLIYRSGKYGMLTDSAKIMFDERDPGFNPRKEDAVYYATLQAKIQRVIQPFEAAITQMMEATDGRYTREDVVSMLRDHGSVEGVFRMLKEQAAREAAIMMVRDFVGKHTTRQVVMAALESHDNDVQRAINSILDF
jgi:hypothetical protein